jgi:saccharopine dehydrogenase-like NADP-dependent oxidoreductase
VQATRVVVLGATGNFGARICRALAFNPGIQAVAAARHPESIAADAESGGAIERARLDLRSTSFADDLRALAPAIVVHCAGPFQGQDYRVAHAVLSAGAHYIDLADGREFVARFADEVGSAAVTADRLAVAGASTLPALSSAVIDALAARFVRLAEIEVIIAPAQRAPRGAATLAAVLSYAGRPFRTWRQGEWHTAYGWLDVERRDLGDLGHRWSAPCDVPDLELFPNRYPGLQRIEFRAALELGVSHLALWLIARAQRAGLTIPVGQFAARLDRMAAYVDGFGTERGGMVVKLTGFGSDGAPLTIYWRLTADHNHGPEIPCMPSILLARKLAAGAIAMRGAHPCMGLLGLDEYAAEFGRWGMTTRIEEDRRG